MGKETQAVSPRRRKHVCYHPSVSRFSPRQSANVVFAMGWADFLLKYRGSVLGYLWSFVVPVVKFLVMLHVFSRYVDIPSYHLYLFLGLIFWEHFSLTTSACIGMLHDKSTIIKKVLMPRILLILSVGWTHIIVLLTYVVIFLLFGVFTGLQIPVSMMYYLPIAMLQATLIALGTGMLLSAFALRYRDIQHLWVVVLQILFWLTPIMYQYKPSAPVLQDLKNVLSGGAIMSLWSVFDIFIRFQPLSILIHDARRVMLYPDTLGIPTAFHVIAFTLVCLAIFITGVIVFQRRSRYFIEEY